MTQDDKTPASYVPMTQDEFLDYAEDALRTGQWCITEPHIGPMLALVQAEKKRRQG